MKDLPKVNYNRTTGKTGQDRSLSMLNITHPVGSPHVRLALKNPLRLAPSKWGQQLRITPTQSRIFGRQVSGSKISAQGARCDYHLDPIPSDGRCARLTLNVVLRPSPVTCHPSSLKPRGIDSPRQETPSSLSCRLGWTPLARASYYLYVAYGYVRPSANGEGNLKGHVVASVQVEVDGLNVPSRSWATARQRALPVLLKSARLWFSDYRMER